MASDYDLRIAQYGVEIWGDIRADLYDNCAGDWRNWNHLTFFEWRNMELGPGWCIFELDGLADTGNLRGEIISRSTISATPLKVDAKGYGQIDGRFSSTTDLLIDVSLAGIIAGRSRITASNSVFISGDLTGVSVITGYLTKYREVAGVVAGSSMIDGNIWTMDFETPSLYILGGYNATSGTPLYTYGWDTTTSGVSLFIEGVAPSSLAGTTLYTHGAWLDDNAITLFIRSKIPKVKDNFTLFVQNNWLGVGDLYPYIPLLIQGLGTTDGAVGFGDGITLIVGSKGDLANEAASLYIDGGGDMNTGVDMYVAGAYISTSGIPLTIESPKATDTDTISLYAHGF